MATGKPVMQSAWIQMLGIEFSPVRHRERLLSALGGFVCIIVVYVVSRATGRHREVLATAMASAINPAAPP